MKIKYHLKDHRHPTHIVISSWTIAQVTSLIAYLDAVNCNFEYVESCK